MCGLQLQDLQPFPAPVPLVGLPPVQMAAKAAYADTSTYVIPQRFSRSQEVILNSHQRVYHAPLFQLHTCHLHASACEAATGCMYLGHACMHQPVTFSTRATGCDPDISPEARLPMS